MTSIAAPVPVRRPELVCWQAAPNGPHLVRNRRTGAVLQFGDDERFLLDRLDGTHSRDEICAAFTGQFHEPLSPQEFDEFLQLAAAEGLLQDAAAAPNGETVAPLSPASAGTAPQRSAAPPRLWARLAARSLHAASRVLKWSAWLPGVAQDWLQRRARRLQFVPRADDVFLVTYPRSGTTWMQMILYQMTTDGAMDVPHIAEFCPWFERSLRAANAFELRPSPRIFKSHLSYRQIPRGAGRYIYVARNGKDVAVSYFHLYRRYNGYTGTFDEFFERFLRGRFVFGSWFEHVRDWWDHRDEDNVLFLTYEELQRDTEGCIRRIADFCGRQLSPEKLRAVKERSSFAFMKQHEHRFDPALETLWEEGVQLDAFLRGGRVGDGSAALNAAQSAQFAQACADRLGNREIPLS
jgi:hypothetical protein